MQAIVALVAVCVAQMDGADWNQFRGPSGSGLTNATDVPLRWSQQENIRWKARLPQAGNGSPIVADGRVFLACAEDQRGLGRSLYCFDAETGRQLWVRTVDFDREMPTHTTNLYCGSTPAAQSGRVVVWHGSAGLHCYDFDGKTLWQRDLGEFRHMWGYGSSPVVSGDRIFLNSGPGRRSFVTAISLQDGSTLWEQPEPHDGDGERNAAGKYMGSWSTPVVTRVNGREQIVCALPTRVRGYDPDTGEVLWTCDGIRGPKGDLAYSSPIVSKSHLCVVIGGFGGPGLGVRLGGSGNVTESHRLWRNEKNPQSIGSGVFVGDALFRVNAARPAPIQCLDAATGRVVWNADLPGICWSSLAGTSDRLYVTTQRGQTIVFRPNSDRFERLAVNPLGEHTNATPAIVNRRIYIRTFQHLYCIGQDPAAG